MKTPQIDNFRIPLRTMKTINVHQNIDQSLSTSKYSSSSNGAPTGNAMNRRNTENKEIVLKLKKLDHYVKHGKQQNQNESPGNNTL